MISSAVPNVLISFRSEGASWLIAERSRLSFTLKIRDSFLTVGVLAIKTSLFQFATNCRSNFVGAAVIGDWVKSSLFFFHLIAAPACLQAEVRRQRRSLLIRVTAIWTQLNLIEFSERKQQTPASRTCNDAACFAIFLEGIPILGQSLRSSVVSCCLSEILLKN